MNEMVPGMDRRLMSQEGQQDPRYTELAKIIGSYLPTTRSGQSLMGGRSANLPTSMPDGSPIPNGASLSSLTGGQGMSTSPGRSPVGMSANMNPLAKILAGL